MVKWTLCGVLGSEDELDVDQSAPEQVVAVEAAAI